MDSISQFVLGAAIGEIVAGRKSGHRALLWGGLAGTIPDLDVLFNPFFTQLQQLSIHRGFSHSLVFGIITGPLLGWLLHGLYQSKCEVSLRRWQWMCFLAIFTHPLLDAFTLYGTQLFLPFSDYRVALNTISIIDPLYTLPLLVACIAAMTVRKRNPYKAAKIAGNGLLLAHAYLLFTCFNKFYVDGRFESAFHNQDIRVKRYLSNPVLFSNILWYTVAETDSAYAIGYYSLVQPEPHIRFSHYSKEHELAAAVRDTNRLKTLRWFSGDYYLLRQKGKGIDYYDIRFGKSDLEAKGDENTFIFYFRIEKPGQFPLSIQRVVKEERIDFGRFFGQLKKAMKGEIREPGSL